MAAEPGAADATLTLNDRTSCARAAWPTARSGSTFAELCEGPRGQADYIEIARCYHTVLLERRPVLEPDAENAARRFITLVDEFYDRHVKLIVAAARR